MKKSAVKVLALVLLVSVVLLVMTGCNRQILDTTYLTHASLVILSTE